MPYGNPKTCVPANLKCSQLQSVLWAAVQENQLQSPGMTGKTSGTGVKLTKKQQKIYSPNILFSVNTK